jgi:methionyl-tRNA synthetase
MKQRRILVTSALPYANGPIHLGHLVEYIQTDIWVRFQSMQGHKVHYVGADDTHGTPIMLRAEADGVTPKQLIDRVWHEHDRDFKGFHISFDNYYTTDSPENRVFCEEIYKTLDKEKLIARRSVEQFYDPVKQMFLPDRYIKGECPKCGAKDQYGDSCEVCGSTYAPTDLKNPYSTVSGAKPERKASEHHFFKLSECKDFLEKWTRSGTLQPEAANKMQEWFAAGLNDWDISRDAPYFGFEIPGAPGKYFYVWLDAPVGYFGSFANYVEKEKKKGHDIKQDEFLKPGHDTEMVHFIGKDILYFHALFWPAMLENSGYRTPSKIFAHGFLTVNGEKMSKSRGTFITAESYLKLELNPEWLRYYYAAKLNGTMEDIDLNLEDFVARVNSDLVGKYINIASRAAGLLHKHFDGRIGELTLGQLRTETLSNGHIVKTSKPYRDIAIEDAVAYASSIQGLYEARQFGAAIRLMMQLADQVNEWWSRQEPWELSKNFDAPQHETDNVYLHRVCSVIIEWFRLLTLFLKPVLPNLAKQVEQFLKLPQPLSFGAVSDHLPIGHQIGKYEHLISRVTPEQIDALVATNKETLMTTTPLPQSPPENAPTITIDDFSKIDLRVAKIVNAEHIEGADKLLKFTLDVGALGTRTVFAGIKSAYEPAALVGRLLVVVANLAPRKMKFGVSEGMVLAASGEQPGIFLLSPDSGAQPGMKVK